MPPGTGRRQGGNRIVLHGRGSSTVVLLKEDRVGFRDWDQCRNQLFRRFGLRKREAYEQLFRMKQTGTVDDVLGSFFELMGYLPNISEETALNALLAALKPKIRLEVVCRRPHTTDKLIDCALEAEELLRAIEDEDIAQSRRPFLAKPDPVPWRLPLERKEAERERKPRRSLRLTEEEFTERKAKGLCFKCDEMFVTGHRCRTELRLVPIPDDNDSNQLEDDEIPAADEGGAQLAVAHVSLKFALGQPSRWCSLQMSGTLLGRTVQILINMGALDNFICWSLADELGLAKERMQPYHIHLGDERNSPSHLVCWHVSLIIQGYTMAADFLPAHNLCIDVILGLEWLITLGWTVALWDLLLLKFCVDGVANVGRAPRQPPPHGSNRHEGCNQLVGKCSRLPHFAHLVS